MTSDALVFWHCIDSTCRIRINKENNPLIFILKSQVWCEMSKCPWWVSLRRLRHPKGGSFVRPAKVSFGVDYLTAVQQLYEIDSEEVLSEDISISSSKKLKWGRIKERRYGAHQTAVRSDLTSAGRWSEFILPPVFIFRVRSSCRFRFLLLSFQWWNIKTRHCFTSKTDKMKSCRCSIQLINKYI